MGLFRGGGWPVFVKTTAKLFSFLVKDLWMRRIELQKSVGAVREAERGLRLDFNDQHRAAGKAVMGRVGASLDKGN
jgi:hypothetical protein